ncbi:MAG: helix-turn-helix transcriptional regulator [Clostridia bacterium]
MDNLSNFTERLRELMQERGLNNSSLEKVSGCPNTTISAWLTKNAFPKPRSLIRLSDYFDCSIDYLLGLTDAPERSRSENPTTFANRITQLTKDKNITFYRVYTDCKIPNNYFSRWLHKNLIPEITTLTVIADYFGCSIEYLLGISDKF